MNIFLQDAATLLDTAVWYAAVWYTVVGMPWWAVVHGELDAGR